MWTSTEDVEKAVGSYDQAEIIEEAVCEIVADEMSGRNYDDVPTILDPDEQITLMLTVADGVRNGGEATFRTTSAAALVITAFDWPCRVKNKKQIQYNIGRRVKELLKTEKHVEVEINLEGPDDWVAV